MAAVVPHLVDLPPAWLFPVVIAIVAAHFLPPFKAHLIKNGRFLQDHKRCAEGRRMDRMGMKEARKKREREDPGGGRIEGERNSAG
jgi:hypothetical protein